MTADLLRFAERVIARADREHPADAVLRQDLKGQRFLPAQSTAQVSHAVFAFYRWLRWLDPHQPLTSQIEHALSLAERFQNQPASFTDAELVALAVPEWLADYMTITPAWARALQTAPRLWLRARPAQGIALCKSLGQCRPFGDGPLADTLEYQGDRDLFLIPEFHTGKFELQDLSSQAVGLLCAPQPGETWWDACAGEGGKTLHLSDLMQNRGLIWATDKAPWRLQRLKRRAARAGVFNYRAALWSQTARLPTKTKFDGVLIDAPCSGTGTWHRNPHARWTTTPSDLQELALLQEELLCSAAAVLKPRGKFIYAVCSLTRPETADVAAKFEKECPAFAPFEIRNPLDPGLPAAAQWYFKPERFGGNGMFVAAWTRTQRQGKYI
ncbi:MAG TPA: RsmB/NOP family class I SAM-dependent RNA methyltransferase [Verrucomicrobiae bacterium]|nr:RsmB/NOP family class I SAM-dependent RNA methyltransferase [Verrucomicrobiae bacterium]